MVCFANSMSSRSIAACSLWCGSAANEVMHNSSCECAPYRWPPSALLQANILPCPSRPRWLLEHLRLLSLLPCLLRELPFKERSYRVHL